MIVKTFTGESARPYLPRVAGLRIRVFREYPYLYDGTMAYEEKYLQSFIRSEKSIVVVAFDDEEVVGASTGIPLGAEPYAIQKPWIKGGHEIDCIFYLSESVLLKRYRGRGVGLRFFEERESWARKLGFERAVFCGVIREPDHPARPADYLELNGFWKKRGYQRKEGYTCKMSWKEISERSESEKELQFWWKNLK